MSIKNKNKKQQLNINYITKAPKNVVLSSIKSKSSILSLNTDNTPEYIYIYMN